MNTNQYNWPGKVILVADDTPTNYFLIKSALRHTNATLIWAKTGLEALAECQKDQPIDLILMDIRMPEMDGYEATREIRKINTTVPIIAQTSYAMQGDMKSSLDAGCNDYIAKPISLEKLRSMIDNYINPK